MSADMIERYLEWRQENEGKPVDVSPKAFALEEALVDLDKLEETMRKHDYSLHGLTALDLENAFVKVLNAYRELHADG